MREPAATRILPPLLLAVGAVASLWAVPALLRTADTVRTARAVDAAEKRLDAGSVLPAFNAALRDIGDAVEPSVVHVSIAGEAKGRGGSRAFTQTGSGWVWDAEGHVVTNAHVVDGASAVEVQLHDGALRTAKLVGLDLRTDIAVLEIEPTDLHPARRSNDLPAQGDMVFAFGSPFEFRFSMSSGIVSGIGRSAGLAEVEYESFIQVDAAINPGNSGGPLVDVRGRVIGMNTAIATGRGSTIGSGQFAGIGLAIPMAIVENVVEQLIEHGSVAKGWLGVSVLDVPQAGSAALRNPAFAEVARRYQGDGAMVTVVSRGSPAEQAGLRPGDVIRSVGARRIATRDDVLSEIGTSRPGTTVAIDVWRPDSESAAGGARMTVRPVLGTLDPELNAGPLLDALRRAGLAGLSDAPFERGDARSGGVRVGRSSGPMAADVPAGSTIVAVDGQRVARLDDLVLRLMRQLGQRPRLLGEPSVALTVVRPDGSEREVELPFR
jgi:S1-C subfamily serine protease